MCPTYCRLGFECEILLIVNCEFLYKTQSKEPQEKEYTMNNITLDHTPFAQAHVLTIANMHAFSISRLFDRYLHAFAYSCRSLRMSLLRFFKPTVNLPTPSQAGLSATVA